MSLHFEEQNKTASPKTGIFQVNLLLLYFFHIFVYSTGIWSRLEALKGHYLYFSFQGKLLYKKCILELKEWEGRSFKKYLKMLFWVSHNTAFMTNSETRLDYHAQMTLEIVPDAITLKSAYASGALRVLIFGWQLLNQVFAPKP